MKPVKHLYFDDPIYQQLERQYEAKYGRDPKAIDKFKSEMQELDWQDGTPDAWTFDPLLVELDNKRIDHIRPDGTKVSYYNEGKFKK